MRLYYLPALFLLLLPSCRSSSPANPQNNAAATALADADPWLTGFEKPAENPILQADSSYTFSDPLTGGTVQWQRADVFNPGAVVRGDSVYLFFRAEDNPRATLGRRTSRIGLAASADGINFTRRPAPVLYPGPDNNREFEDPGGCEDPRVVELPDGRYLMLDTAYNQKAARLCSATSTNLTEWTKHGPVFQDAYGG